MPLRRSQAADYIDRALRAEGYTPIHERDEQNGVATDNIYVDIAGSAQPASYVLVTGHYDNWHLGADDNASAVAVLLQAAHIFVGQRPRRSAAHRCLRSRRGRPDGSERFAERHAADSIYAVLNMDCVAFASHEENSQSAPPGLGLRSIGDFLAVLANVLAASPLSQVAALSSRPPQPVDVLGLLAPAMATTRALRPFCDRSRAVLATRVPALFFTDTANFPQPQLSQEERPARHPGLRLPIAEWPARHRRRRRSRRGAPDACSIPLCSCGGLCNQRRGGSGPGCPDEPAARACRRLRDINLDLRAGRSGPFTPGRSGSPSAWGGLGYRYLLSEVSSRCLPKRASAGLRALSAPSPSAVASVYVRAWNPQLGLALLLFFGDGVRVPKLAGAGGPPPVAFRASAAHRSAPLRQRALLRPPLSVDLGCGLAGRNCSLALSGTLLETGLRF